MAHQHIHDQDSHDPAEAGLGSGRQAGVLKVAFLASCVATVVGLVWLYPYGGPPEADQQGFSAVDDERLRGRITSLQTLEIGDPFLLPGAVSVLVEVTLDSGDVVQIDAVDEGGLYRVGQPVVVAQVNAADTGPPLYAIVDLPRGPPLLLLAIAFGLAVIALGRWQGVRAMVGLGISAVLIVAFLVPALLDGHDATAVALVTSMAVMLVTVPLSHGWSRVTLAASMGTVAALVLTVALASLAAQLTNLTGLASEDVQLVRFATGQAIDLRGLLVAGMIIGTLGVLDDVTVSQASTVEALRRAAPGHTDRAVFADALRVGRDHIAATVNTLFLAYAGASLPLLMLFSVGGAPLLETLTSELVAQEVVRTLVGSIGLIAAVPLTTGLAVLVSRAPEAVPGRAGQTPDATDGVPDDARSGTDVDGPAVVPDWEAELRESYGLDGPDPAR